jgi:hypothetical protein
MNANMSDFVRDEWDMYVDLPANAVRYCFRTIADASALKQRFVRATEGRAAAGRH